MRMLDCLLVSAIIFYMYKVKIWMGVVTSLQWDHQPGKVSVWVTKNKVLTGVMVVIWGIGEAKVRCFSDNLGDGCYEK